MNNFNPYSRKENTNERGGAWTPQEIQAVWQKGTHIPGYDPNLFRRDVCGAAMSFSEHGNRNHEYGWEIDHINPVDNGGKDNLYNLQPLQWRNNASKSNKTNWTCAMR